LAHEENNFIGEFELKKRMLLSESDDEDQA